MRACVPEIWLSCVIRTSAFVRPIVSDSPRMRTVRPRPDRRRRSPARPLAAGRPGEMVGPHRCFDAARPPVFVSAWRPDAEQAGAGLTFRRCRRLSQRGEQRDVLLDRRLDRLLAHRVRPSGLFGPDILIMSHLTTNRRSICHNPALSIWQFSMTDYARLDRLYRRAASLLKIFHRYAS